MTVDQLIKRLSRFDPTATVAVVDNHWADYVSTDPVVRRARITDPYLLSKGVRDPDGAESVVLITFKQAGSESDKGD